MTLKRNGTIVDQFSQVGFDTGTAESSGGLSTLDRMLRRKAGITQGPAPLGAPAAWDLPVEWEGFAKNRLNGLGSR